MKYKILHSGQDEQGLIDSKDSISALQRVLVIAGGTGGHIFPGLAVAQALHQQQVDVHWLGSDVGLERELVSSHYPFICIRAKRVRGKQGLSHLLTPFFLLRATWQAWQSIRRLQPDVVLAMGGFVCAPGGIAAKLARKPLVIHEQNAIAGYTNRMLSRFADVVLTAFPNTFADKRHPCVVGNPVRADIMTLPLKASDSPGTADTVLRLLILGGSQGAKAINQRIVQMLQIMPNTQQLQVWHQTGKTDYESVQQAYQHLGLTARVNAFIHDMAAAYQWADLVVCRSGALTVSELAGAGVASILIPFPYAVDDHQWHNGRYLATANGAILLREYEATAQRLSTIIQQLMADRSQLASMAQQARQLAKPQAVNAVISYLRQAKNK